MNSSTFLHLRLFTAVALAAAATAQNPIELVADLNRIGSGVSSNPSIARLEPWENAPDEMIQIGGVGFFTAEVVGLGRELWKTDGTEAGTLLVRDIHTGPGDSDPEGLDAFGDKLIFRADDGITGSELWISDGTEGGTRRVADINPGAASSSPGYFAVRNGVALFAANDGVHGNELWKTDGTAAGTSLVKDIEAGAGSSDPGLLTLDADGTDILFHATTFAHGAELWASQATAATTRLVKDINVGGSSSLPRYFQNLNGVTLFTATAHGPRPWLYDVELFVTDGTAAGTTMIKEFRAGPNHGGKPDLSRRAVLHGELYFSAEDDTYGRELWKTDGTPSGTVLAADIRPGAAGSSPAELYVHESSAEAGGLLVFAADDGTHGKEPWSFDGLGERLLGDLKPGGGSRGSSSPKSFRSLAGDLVALVASISGSSSNTDRELVLLDISNAAVTAIDLNAGPGSSEPGFFTKLASGVLAFFAKTIDQGLELFRTDGTQAGTVVAKDVEPRKDTQGSDPGELHSADATHLVVRLDDGQGGDEPYLVHTDGTIQQVEITAGSPGSATRDFLTIWNGSKQVTIGVADNTYDGATLLAFDGVTPPVPLLAAGPGTALRIGNPVQVGHEAWFTVDDFSTSSMWKTDATVAGTVKLFELGPGAVGPLTAVEGAVYFPFDDLVTGDELFFSDGTLLGTHSLDINPNGDSQPLEITWLGGRNVVLSAVDENRERHGWTSDGTKPGTGLVIRTNPNGNSNPTAFRVKGDQLVYSAYSPLSGEELYLDSVDFGGQPRLFDLEPGPDSSRPLFITITDNDLIFCSARTSGAGREPWWIFRGGFPQTFDVHPGTASSYPTDLTAIGDGVYFGADDGTHGSEVWRAEGFAKDPEMVYDFNPNGGSNPSGFTLSDGVVYFSVTDGYSGQELARLRVSTGSIERLGEPCHGPAEIASSVPFLGQTFDLVADALFSGEIGALLFGAQADRPWADPITWECPLHLAADKPIITVGAMQTPLQVSILVPNFPDLVGKQIIFQGVWLEITTNELGTTNGILATIGRH